MKFGQLIRAYRLRWGRLPHAQGMMRLSVDIAGYVCELCPLGELPQERSVGGREYVIWWEKDGGRGLVDESPFLRSLTKVKQPFTVVLNEEGTIKEMRRDESERLQRT